MKSKSCIHEPCGLRVMCVDDNDLVAEAIGRKLTLAGGYTWLGQLREASGLLEAVDRLKPHVILLDIDMPGADPFEMLAELTAQRPDSTVIMLSGYVRLDLIERSIECGALGYVSKNETTQTLLDAIQRAAQGEFVLGPEARRIHDSNLV